MSYVHVYMRNKVTTNANGVTNMRQSNVANSNKIANNGVGQTLQPRPLLSRSGITHAR